MIPDFLYGTAWKEDATAALTELALRSGFRGIDTANQRRHYYEAGVGQGLAAAIARGSSRAKSSSSRRSSRYQAGQDHRLPYDPAAPTCRPRSRSRAPARSSTSERTTSTATCCTAPPSGHGWTAHDSEVWGAMARERDAGRVRLLGVSNVSLRHLQQLAASGGETPAFVQNRCYARVGWDWEVRPFCATQKIVYQGFSLLTANVEALRHPLLVGIAARHRRRPPRSCSGSRRRSACSR